MKYTDLTANKPSDNKFLAWERELYHAMLRIAKICEQDVLTGKMPIVQAGLIPTIKRIRSITNWGLKDARDFCEGKYTTVLLCSQKMQEEGYRNFSYHPGRFIWTDKVYIKNEPQYDPILTKVNKIAARTTAILNQFEIHHQKLPHISVEMRLF